MDINIKWNDNPLQLSSLPPARILAWLTKPSCLSAALKMHGSVLTVKLLSWQPEQARIDELQRLGLSLSEPTRIREVILQGDGVAWTTGRVIVPEITYQQFAAQFDNLGEKLLGETLLYNNDKVTRSNFEYALLNEENALWARRSVFTIEKSYPILVTETFLPAIPDYVAPTTR
jgi:chorismate--pyruvate lyase